MRRRVNLKEEGHMMTGFGHVHIQADSTMRRTRIGYGDMLKRSLLL
jgi:hypothetical protein